MNHPITYSTFLAGLSPGLIPYLPPSNTFNIHTLITSYQAQDLIDTLYMMENGELGCFSYAFGSSLKPDLLQYHNKINSTHLYPGLKQIELSSLYGILLIIQYLQYHTSSTHQIKLSSSSTYLSTFVDKIEYLPPQHQLKIHK